MANSIWDVSFNNTEEVTYEYRVAEPGTYEFRVDKFDAMDHQAVPGGKIGHCVEFDMQLLIKAPIDGEEHEVRVFDRLYSDPKTKWKIAQFAKCVGIYHDGIDLQEIYHKALGTKGTAKIGIHEYQGQKSNDVKAYIVSEDKKQQPEIDPNDLPF